VLFTREFLGYALDFLAITPIYQHNSQQTQIYGAELIQVRSLRSCKITSVSSVMHVCPHLTNQDKSIFTKFGTDYFY
jgi:hypothetical protein